MKIVKEYNVIDFAKYAFNSNKPNASYVYTTIQYTDYDDFDDIDWYAFKKRKHVDVDMFYCEQCREKYNLKTLKIKDNTIYCNCGHTVHVNDLRPYDVIDGYYSSERALATMHNINNGTINKLNVPSIIRNQYFYCPKCHKTGDIYSYEKENGILTCTCGAHYTFDECKLVPTTGTFVIAGGSYIDNNKISLSVIKQHCDLDRNGNYFWSTGNTRCTMNIETGYTYLTNTGYCYTEHNKVWKKYNKGKAPKMFNATYCELNFGHIVDVSSAKIKELILKYSKYPNLVKNINDNKLKLQIILEKKISLQIDNYMTAYLNNKYNYKIKSLVEIIREEGAKTERFDTLDLLIKHNRFINADYKDLKYNLSILYNNIKLSNMRKYFRKMHRETNHPILDLVSATASMSKSLRKKIANDYTGKRLDWNDGIFLFITIAQYFEKKENVNKLYDILKFKYCPHYNINDDIEFWLKFRSEEYISNLKSYNAFDTKFWDIKDSIRMISMIKSVYGDDWNIDSIDFHNEKQYHDSLTEIISSKSFQDAQDAKRKAQMSEPFKMEETVFELQNKDITIALNEYELSKIGAEMHICVGGYGNAVKNGNCRIAYIQENGEYKACLELRSFKQKDKQVYELHQAKLKYNNYVGTNERYFNIVTDWCKDNNIEIKTHDMNKNFKEESLCF